MSQRCSPSSRVPAHQLAEWLHHQCCEHFRYGVVRVVFLFNDCSLGVCVCSDWACNRSSRESETRGTWQLQCVLGVLLM